MVLKPVLRSLPALFCLLLLTGRIGADVGTPIPPPPARWVTDEAGFLSASVRESLDIQLEEYAYSTGHQLLIFIAPTSGGIPIEDWAVRAFAAWRVGRQGIDDGLVLFIMSQDRTMRIEVGYGLEGVITDAAAARIINDILVPGIRAGDHDRTLSDAVTALLAAIGGTGAGQEGEPGQKKAVKPMSLGQMILIGILVIGFLILLITNPSLAIYLLFSILSGGRGGGRSGGGFFGGGGRSGGGGASGSW